MTPRDSSYNYGTGTDNTGKYTASSGNQNSFTDTTGNYATSSGDQSTFEKARDATSDAIDTAQEKVGQVADKVKEQATGQLSTQKDRVADGLDNMANMIRMSSNQMRDNNQGMIAEYTDRAAQSIENASQFLRERNLNDIVGEVESLARREPALFLGGAFTLGLLAARFLKSSSPRSQQQSSGTQGRTGYGYSNFATGNPQPASRYINQGAAVRYPGDEDLGYGESALGNVDITSTPAAIDPKAKGITGSPAPGTTGTTFNGTDY